MKVFLDGVFKPKVIKFAAGFPLMRYFTVIVTFLFFFILTGKAQVVANFSLPDTICTNKPVVITNLTTGGSTFYWSFCSGNTGNVPVGSVMNNPRVTFQHLHISRLHRTVPDAIVSSPTISTDRSPVLPWEQLQE